MKVFSFLFVVIYLSTAAKAAWDQPLRNYLGFSAELAKTGRVLAAFSSAPNTLSVCYRQEGGKGWSIAESNDGYTWKQIQENKLPVADDGDVIASKLVPQYSHLIAFDSGDKKVTFGGAKSPRLDGFVKIVGVDGRSPSFFKFKNDIQYLAVLHPTKNEVVFYKVQPTSSGGIQLVVVTKSAFKLGSGDIRALQVFCFDDDKTKCLMSYSMRENKKWFRPYYSVGKFEDVGGQLEFQPALGAGSLPYLTDAGQSASDFRFVKFGERDVMAIGWNGNSDYQIPPDTPDFGNSFTIPRNITYSDEEIFQTPLDFEINIEKKELYGKQDKDTVLSSAGLSHELTSEKAYLLDLFLYSPRDFEQSGYQIDLLGSKNRKVSIRFNPTAEKIPQDMLWGVNVNDTILPAGLDKPVDFTLGLLDPTSGQVKLYVDKTTLTVSFEDGLGFITQSYNLGDGGPFSSVVVKPTGQGTVTLKANSSISQIRSIWDKAPSQTTATPKATSTTTTPLVTSTAAKETTSAETTKKTTSAETTKKTTSAETTEKTTSAETTKKTTSAETTTKTRFTETTTETNPTETTETSSTVIGGSSSISLSFGVSICLLLLNSMSL